MSLESSSTIFIPTKLKVTQLSPPTPAPSPGPSPVSLPVPDLSYAPLTHQFSTLPPIQRKDFLLAILRVCSPDELHFVAATVDPLLKRDFLRDLPPELALHVLGFIDHPMSLSRASRVNTHWNKLTKDDQLWQRLCQLHGFDTLPYSPSNHWDDSDSEFPSTFNSGPHSKHSTGSITSPPTDPAFSYRAHFKSEYTTVQNWHNGGTLLRNHRVPYLAPPHRFPDRPHVPDPQSSYAIPTSIALDSNWVIVGLSNCQIHVYSARSGVLHRTLVGHSAGVWAVSLVKAGGQPPHPLDPLHPDNILPPFSHYNKSRPSVDSTTISPEDQISSALRAAVGLDSPLKRLTRRKSMSEAPLAEDVESALFPFSSPNAPEKPSDPSGASDGWGQPNFLVVSSGCDKEIRVWDIVSGACIYALQGHRATVRCLKVLHNRPIAVTGSRDRTVRVWDIQHGQMLRVLEGHDQSIRCLDVCGNRVVSGSYDCTCRIWDISSGKCLHVLRGHFQKVYCVAFDGVRVVSGGCDTTIRVWDAETGTCLTLLQGHTGLVCHLQLSPTRLITGGSDGRIIIFTFDPSSSNYKLTQSLVAHESSITSLHANERFLVTGGADGRARLFHFTEDQADDGGVNVKGGLDGKGGKVEKAVVGKYRYVRELSEPSENVWKVACTKDICVVLCRRAGKTDMEMWSFRPREV